MIPIVLKILIIVFLLTDIVIEYRKLKEIKPMEKVIRSQSLNNLDIAIIYKTLDLQIKFNNSMAKNKFLPKEKIEELKVVNKETKNTLKKIKAIAKEAGVEL